MGKLFEELKRRKVFRVAAVYAVVAWVLVQVSSTVLPTFEAPDWANQTLTFFLILGFPVAVVLAWAYEITPEGIRSDDSLTQSQRAQIKSAHPINYLILGIVVIVAGVQFFDRAEVSPGDVSDVNGSGTVQTPELEILNLNLGEIYTGGASPIALDISPDGRTITYSSTSGFMTDSYLHIRRFSDDSSDPLVAQSTRVASAKFSPNGQRILFEELNQGLNLIPAFGGSPTLISSNLDASAGFSWVDDSRVLYVGLDRTIYELDLDTNDLTPRLQASLRPIANPLMLPGEQAILYIAKPDSNSAQIEILEISTGEQSVLVPDASYPMLLQTGHLLFTRGNEIWAVEFDSTNLRLIGDPLPVLEDVSTSIEWNRTAIAISETGRLVYKPAEPFIVPAVVPVWIDRNGNVENILIEPDFYSGPRLSPDEKRLALFVEPSESEYATDIWVYDFETQGKYQITFHKDVQDLVWSPDGNYIYYGRRSADNNGSLGIWKIDSNGEGQPEQILESSLRLGPKSITDDGNQIVYIQGETSNFTVMISSIGAENRTQQLIPHEGSEYEAILSADQEWIAYTERTEGPHSIFVRRFGGDRNNSGKWLISENARQPMFSNDGGEIYYIDFFDTNNLMAKQILSYSPFTTSNEPSVIAENIFRETGNGPSYDISSDGERYLLLQRLDSENELSEQERVELVVVNNWLAELNRLVPITIN